MAKIKIIIRKNSKLKNGNIPVAIRLSHLKLQATHITLSGLFVTNPKQWNGELQRFSSKKKSYKTLNKALNLIEDRANEILETLLSKNNFSYELFKKYYKNEHQVPNDVFVTIDSKIQTLLNEGRFGNAKVYLYCKTSLVRFTRGRNITFNDINYSFLKRLEEFYLSRGMGGNSISLMLRTLRSIVYEYYKTISAPKPTYFLDFKMQRLKTETRKRALTKDEIKKLIEYNPISYNERRSIDIFLFSFFCNGINVKDISTLTPANIVNGRLEYRRAKTKGLFSIKITEPMREILNRYEGNKYLFPIIKGNNFGLVQYDTFRNNLNRTLRRVAKKIDIDNSITIYAARSSFAQAARDEQIDIFTISSMLGHQSVETTKIYLNSLSNTTLDEAASNAFKGL